MKKPKPKTIVCQDWHQATEFIESKYKIQTRDYASSHAQFGEWCDAKGYGLFDADGQSRGSSQRWYAEFQSDIKSGAVVDRPYQDFWHWIIDVTNPVRGGFIQLDEEMGEDAEPWQREILALYLKEFPNAKFHTDW